MSTDGPRAGTWQGGAGEGERWLPILEVTGGVFIGLSAAHAWVVGTSRGVTLLEAAPAAALLPLLELTPDVVRARIGDALDTAQLGRDAAAAFPLPACVVAGLASRSTWWAAKALAWAEALPPTDAIAAAARATATAGWASQAVRHRARRVATGRPSSCP